MNPTDLSVVIVGAGLAGVTTAESLRRLGHTGPITLINAEPHAPYDRPPLSKECLAPGAAETAPTLRDDAFWGTYDVARRDGVAAVAIDRDGRTVRLSDGTDLAYDRLVLATGADARRLPAAMVDPAATDRIHYLRSLDDALRLRDALASAKHLVVVGAGFIGLEAAAAARAAGVAVTVLEAAARPVARSGPTEIAGWLTDLHEGHGVRFRFAARLDRIDATTDGLALRLADGSVIAADAVVVGIGSTANLALAAACGLACSDGIETDASGRSSDRHVFAVGDVAATRSAPGAAPHRAEHWEAARLSGEAAAAAILGAEPPAPAVPWVWSDQYGEHIQFLGAYPEGANVVLRSALTSPRWCSFHLVDGVVKGAVLLNAGGQRRIVERLIREAHPIDSRALADEAVALKTLTTPSPRPTGSAGRSSQ
jgi:NADPH-dependent 2,4-dienoyl-CoA reductase/sulfur reductase-like enzyme